MTIHWLVDLYVRGLGCRFSSFQMVKKVSVFHVVFATARDLIEGYNSRLVLSRSPFGFFRPRGINLDSRSGCLRLPVLRLGRRLRVSGYICPIFLPISLADALEGNSFQVISTHLFFHTVMLSAWWI